jgi:beta-N-acetylhexosaminidase
MSGLSGANPPLIRRFPHARPTLGPNRYNFPVSALRSVPLVVVLVIAIASGGRAHTVQAQSPQADEALLERMSPRERVGQLFIVQFDGVEVDDAAIGTLLTDYRVGGVLLDPARGNFTDAPDAPGRVAMLTTSLQTTAMARSPRIPLLVALEQSGDGYPGSPLRGGMTPLPSHMAIGATWEPDYAERIGAIVGRELAAAGVNLLFGPTLDVLTTPQPGRPGDLGVRSFGGSPYWVGRLGARYIEGVHDGGSGRVATAAGHFPGIGGADRSPEEEIAVVEKTFQQLAATELVPFAAVAGDRIAPGVTDAFVTSHVRYRGVQQQVDRPLSLDSGGLRYLLSQLPQLAEWRANGGVLISPGLGLAAVRRYDDPNLRSFNHRRVVRESIAAGHDLILLTGLGVPGDPESEMGAITDTLNWLLGEYEEDEALRDFVDDAVLRVLGLKRRLYPNFSAVEVRVDPLAAAAATGLGTEDVLAVAGDALTRVTPAGAAPVSGSAAAPRAPQVGDAVLFVVDARENRPCLGCDVALALDPAKLLASVRRTYGRQGAHRVEDEDVQSITFTDLKAWLQSTGAVAPEDTVAFVPPLTAERTEQVGRLVRAATWLVFAMRDVRPADAPGSDALKLYLKATPQDTADQRVVALAFTAPYYLDTTEIAKLSAYYVLYSRTEPFLEVAVRALFGDQAARGASPVSVPGAGYDLFRSLEPTEANMKLELVGTASGVPVPVGANLTIRTSAVHDANGHIVPDGTQITFRRFARAEGLFLPDIEVETHDGRATVMTRLERPGELEISGVFANGLRTEPLVVTVEGRPGEALEPSGAAAMAPVTDVPRPPVDWSILILSLGAMLLAGVIGTVPRAAAEPTRMLRTFLLSFSWGLGGYLLVAAGGLELEGLGLPSLWPDNWGVAYQAPVFSFALALMPIAPAAVSDVFRRV